MPKQKINVDNLRLLEAKLRTVGEDQFDMGAYRDDGNYLLEDMHNCNTVACAAGWAPTIPDLRAKASDCDEAGDLDYERYLKRVFGFGEFSEVWSYLFSGNWDRYDNTPEGAADRIDHLCTTGEPGGLPWNE